MQKRKIPGDKVPTSKNYLKKPEISEYLEKKRKKKRKREEVEGKKKRLGISLPFQRNYLKSYLWRDRNEG